MKTGENPRALARSTACVNASMQLGVNQSSSSNGLIQSPSAAFIPIFAAAEWPKGEGFLMYRTSANSSTTCGVSSVEASSTTINSHGDVCSRQLTIARYAASLRDCAAVITTLQEICIELTPAYRFENATAVSPVAVASALSAASKHIDSRPAGENRTRPRSRRNR